MTGAGRSNRRGPLVAMARASGQLLGSGPELTATQPLTECCGLGHTHRSVIDGTSWLDWLE